MKPLSKIVMVLALGAVMSLPCIMSCKKSQPDIFARHQMYSRQDNNSVTHTPIPGTLVLLGSGLAGMGFLGWRKRNKH